MTKFRFLNVMTFKINDNMKTIKMIILFMILIMNSFVLFSQEKKPTLMILPSDNWCNQRLFMTTYNNQGLMVKIPDYQRAFLEDSEIGPVISKLGELMTKRGYSLKDAEQETKNVYARAAEDNVSVSHTSGSSFSESPLDVIKRRAKMDVIIQIDWKINRETSGKSVTFTIEAFDAYTSKRVATATGTGNYGQSSVPMLLEEAINSRIKLFDKQLSSYYSDLYKNGREIILYVRCWDNWDYNLESEFGDDYDELLDCIQKWMRKNTVNASFNLSDVTENFAQFEQVRIPLYNQDNEALDARLFATGLRKYLMKTYGITAKVMTRGLGEAIIVLGEK